MRKLLSILMMVAFGFLGAALFAAVKDELPFHFPGSDYFTDVSRGSPHDNDIGYAREYGVVFGYPDGLYRPEEAVTREQMATFIMRSSAYDPFTSWIIVDDQYFDGYYFGRKAFEDGVISWEEYDLFQDFLDWYFGLLNFENGMGAEEAVPLVKVRNAAKAVLARERASGYAPTRKTAAERAALAPKAKK